MVSSKCQLPQCLALSFVKLIFICCLLIRYGNGAEEAAVKSQANAAMAAEQRQIDMLKTSVQPFFNINNDFLNIVQRNSLKGAVLTDLVGNITDVNKTRTFNNYIDIARPIVVTYPGYVALFLFGLLLFILIPIIGVFWCSCRCCCHKCGARAKPMDGRYARCRRGTFGVILGILCTLILAGSVLAFISNDLLHRPFRTQSVDNPVTKFNSSLHEIIDNLETILRTFNNQTLLLLMKQVPRVRESVASASLKAQTETVTKTDIAGILTMWKSVSGSLSKYLNVSRSIESDYGTLVDAYNSLVSNLPNLTDPLKEAFNSCTTAECSSASRALERFGLSFNASSVNTDIVNKTIESIKVINISQTTNYLEFANDTLHNISVKITNLGEAEINNVVANLNDSKKIESYFLNSERFIFNITTALRQITGILTNSTLLSKRMRPFLAEIDQYRMYGYFGVGSTILLIIFFYYLGLCFGACGEPPYEDARLCNRGVGATLMSCGVGFTFLFFPIVMIITMALFMVGGPIRTEVCRYLLNDMPNGYSTLDYEISHILGKLNLSFAPGFPYPPNLTYHIMGDCKNNTSIVTAFNLEDLINGTMIYDSEVRPSILNLQKTIRKVNLDIDVSSLESEQGTFIDKLQGQGITKAAFSQIIAELQKNVVTNFNELVVALRAADASLNETQDVNSTISSLTTLIEAVNNSRMSMISKMEVLKDISNIENIVAKLRGKLATFGANTKTNGKFLSEIIDNAFNALDVTVKNILVNAVEMVLNQYASCRVLHQQVKGLVDLVCVKILNPFNGFWLGIGWCLLILIPSMIFACKLNYLYRKTEYYVKDYEEPDYMSYQGFYPSDSIPLERKSRGKNKQSKARGRNASKSRGSAGGGILRHTGPPDPLPSGAGCGPGAAGGGLNRRGWQHPYTKLPVYPRDAYD